MASVREIEHAPECGVGVRFGDLEEGEVGRIGRGEGEFVDWRDDAGICN
jgi:hypothetical protein